MCVPNALNKDLAAKDLLARDRKAKETLALLDPSLEGALDADMEVGLGEAHSTRLG